MATRLAIGGRRGSWPRGPRTSRTQHSCGLRRPGPAGPGGCAGEPAPAGPDTPSFPGPWPFKKRRAHPPQGGGQLGRAHGWGGSSGDGLLLRGAARRGSGGLGMVLRHQARTHGGSVPLTSFRPPTHRRAAAPASHRSQEVGRGRRPIQASGCRGCGRGPTRADSWSRDVGRSSLRLAPLAPVRHRLAGRPVAQCRRKRLISKTSLVWSMW